MGKLFQLRPHARVEELSDVAVAAACATGDRVAQGLMFERHVDTVHRFIARMRGADSIVVDDLVQATFLAAYQSADRFRGPNLRGWLIGIAANTVRAHIRKEVAQRRTVAALTVEPVERVTSPRNLDLARVREAVTALPVKLRELVVLVDLEGESAVAAAAILKIPEGTAWRRLAEARRRLQLALRSS